MFTQLLLGYSQLNMDWPVTHHLLLKYPPAYSHVITFFSTSKIGLSVDDPPIEPLSFIMALNSGYLHGDAFDQGDLPVSDIHTVHYAQYGKPDGKPGNFPGIFAIYLNQVAKLTPGCSHIPARWTGRWHVAHEHIFL